MASPATPGRGAPSFPTSPGTTTWSPPICSGTANRTSPGTTTPSALRQHAARPHGRPRDRAGHRGRPLAGRRDRDAARRTSTRSAASGWCSCRAVGSGPRSPGCSAPYRARCRVLHAHDLLVLRARCRQRDQPGLRRVGLRAPHLEQEWRTYVSLTAPQNRHAFVRTLRSVIDLNGQSVSAHDRLYLASKLPTLILWGQRDRIIPVDHASAAHRAIPAAGSRSSSAQATSRTSRNPPRSSRR